MKNYKLDFEEISKELSFFSNADADRYFCDCGGFLKVDHSEEEEILKEASSLEDSSPYDDSLNEIINNFKIYGDKEHRCPLCNTSFSTKKANRKLIDVNEYFVSGFKFENTQDNLKIFHSKVKSLVVPKLKPDGFKDMDLLFYEELCYINFNKETRVLTFKEPAKKEREFDLDEIVNVVDTFLTPDTQVIVNLFDLHSFTNNLATHVSDIKSINIVKELLSKLRGRHNEAGTDIFKKIWAIFFGIIKYSSLSTVALTKGSTFLYDIMKECRIPKPEILQEEGATSPLDIFNFLTQNYIKALNEEINEDNKEVHEFSFVGKKLRETNDNIEVTDEEGKLNISIKNKNKYIEGKVVKTESGYKVIDTTNNRRVSKYLFKVIRNFSDYKKLIKYLKIISYEELMDMLTKYDINLLTYAIDLVYFRDGINYSEIKRLFPIFEDFAKTKTYQVNPTLKEQEINYRFLMDFSFTEYDDTLLMLNSLKFDPRKEFYKIKTYNHLKTFHDSVLKYYNVMSDADKNGNFRYFVSKFRYLEAKNDYQGPLVVKLLSTPAMVIKEGSDMKHSGASYINRIMNGQYLLLQVFDTTDGIPKDEPVRFTMGLFYDETAGLEFDQVKAACNIQGSDRFKKEVMSYLETKEISYRPLRDLKLKG